MRRDIAKGISGIAIDAVKADEKDVIDKYFEDTLAVFLSGGIQKYAEEAERILKVLTAAELGLKKNIRASTVAQKNKNIVITEMKKAYALIMDFRTFITKEKIEYLIQYDSKNLSTIAILNTKQILDSVTGLSTQSGGGLKFNLSSSKIKDIIENDATDTLSKEFVKRVKDILNLIIELNKNTDGSIMTQEEFNEMRRKYGKKAFSKIKAEQKSFINQGYALEAALQVVLNNEDQELLLDIGKRYKAYFDAIENTAVFRSGGDLNKEATKKLKKIGKNFKTLMEATQLQVKRVREKASAQLVTLNSIIAELGTIVLIYKSSKDGSQRSMQQKFKKYFTSSLKSSDYLEKVKKELEKDLENNSSLKEIVDLLDRYFNI